MPPGRKSRAMTAQKKQQEEKKDDLRNLQDKFHDLLDQRNHYNDLAREARDGRNLLNDQRREKAAGIQEHKEARDKLNAKMREHKELRNIYQDQAKALIAQRKGKAGAIERSVPLQVRKLRNEIQGLLEKQETSVMTPAKENALLESVREKRKDLKGLEAQLDEQKALSVDLTDTDKAIDELFANADEEHAKVVAIQKEATEHHKKFVEAIKETRVVQAEADEKHQEFIALKTKADGYHEKAMELREKVMGVKKERRQEFQERKKEIQDVNKRAKKAVDDPEKRKEVEDDALEMLKKGGKISL